MTPTTTDAHDLREVGQVLLGLPVVQAVDVFESPDGPQLEAVVGPDLSRVPPRILRIAGRHDVGLDPDASGSRGEPTHYIVVLE